MGTRLRQLGTYALFCAILCAIATMTWSCANASSSGERPHEAADDIRTDALMRAQVFRHPARPDLLRTGWAGPDELTCRFLPVPTSGTTPKFTCELADGTRVKVKYGSSHEV